MNIIKQKWIFLNSVMEYVPKQVSRLYKFGFFAFGGETSYKFKIQLKIGRPKLEYGQVEDIQIFMQQEDFFHPS